MRLLTLGRHVGFGSLGFMGSRQTSIALDEMLAEYGPYGLDIVEWSKGQVLSANPRLRRFTRTGKIRVVSYRKLPKLLADEGYLADYGHYLDRWLDNRVRSATNRWDLPLSSIAHDLPLTESHLLDSYLSGGLQAFDSIVCPTHSAMEVVQRAFEELDARSGLRRPRPTLSTIPHGVSVSALRPIPRQRARKLLRLPADRTIFISTARFSFSRKTSLDSLLVAFADLLSRRGHRSSVLVLAGGSRGQASYVAYIRSLAARLGIERSVRLFTDFPDSQKRVLLSAADVFVAASDNIQESYGLALVEAMASGLPVLASSWNGHREVVRQERTGLLVSTYLRRDLLDSPRLDHLGGHSSCVSIDIPQLTANMDRMAGDPKLRSRMGECARETAYTSYDWSVVVPRFLRFWKERHARARHAFPATPQHGAIRYGSLFLGFESDKLSGRSLLNRTRLGNSALETQRVSEFFPSEDLLDELSWTVLPAYASLGHDLCERVLKAASRPVRFAELSRLCEDRILVGVVIMRLLKLGMLELVT